MGQSKAVLICTGGFSMSPSITSGTLYTDWLLRRERLREYHGEREPIVATQLRVLDYLVERYRGDAEALRPAPPPLDAVYVNQRAIVVNHHRSFGLVAGVKSPEEAASRVAGIVARMYDPARGEASGIDLERAAVADDPWFGWDEPNDRAIREYWGNLQLNLPKWFSSNPARIKSQMEVMPFLTAAFIGHLGSCVERPDVEGEWAAELLAGCRNRMAVGYIAHAWRMRIAAGAYGSVTTMLREALWNWDRHAADPVRCLLSDECCDVRVAAAGLLAEIGELRDIGMFADLLAMPELPDEGPEERGALAAAMERLASRLQEPSRALG
jgi:hypothetical protein